MSRPLQQPSLDEDTFALVAQSEQTTVPGRLGMKATAEVMDEG